MIRWCLAVLVLCGGPAGAADFCDMAGQPSAWQTKGFARALAGDWQGRQRSGMVLGGDGVMRRLVPDPAPQLVQLGARRGVLQVAGGALFEAAELAPAPGPLPLSLPREVGISASSLLAEQVAESRVACAVETLPQYGGKAQIAGAMAVTYHLFVLAPDAMVMVVMGAGDGQRVRVIVDLQRP